MSFAATLRDLSFHELLHLVSFNKRSGRLRLTSRDGHALLLFRHGLLIYAASTSLRESFGSILLCRGLVTEADLRGALEQQDRFAHDRRLGAILVAMGKVSEGEVREAVKQQALRVLSEVHAWKDAYFRFDTLGPLEGESDEGGLGEVLVREGFGAEALLLEAVTSREHGGQSEEEFLHALATATLAARPAAEVLSVPPGWQPPSGGERAASLESLAAEIRSPAFTGEVALALLRYAAQLVARGLFLVIGGGEARAVGRFGFGEDRSARHGTDDLRVPLLGPSLLVEVVENREAYRGGIPPTRWNDHLLERLGGPRPTEAVLIPMIVGGRVEFIFYGDNVPDLAPLRATQGLEYLMIEAGLAMERLARTGAPRATSAPATPELVEGPHG
jgi:hypothetical protein